MFHDRVSFGGTLIAVGSLYMWMAGFPCGVAKPGRGGFSSSAGSSALAVSGLSRLRLSGHVAWHRHALSTSLFYHGAGSLLHFSTYPAPISSLLNQRSASLEVALGFGRLCLLATAVGMILGGLTIMIVGMTSVFVPQDLTYMGITAADLDALNPRLIPLIAHDRAGFGGGICLCGITVLFCVWCGTPSRSLWQVLCLAGAIGFFAAIAIHPIVGYNDLILWLGSWEHYLTVGLVLTKAMCSKTIPFLRRQSHNLPLDGFPLLD